MGWMPMDVASGSKIGVAMRIIGAMSMMQPKTSKITLIISASAIRFVVTLVIAFAASSGTCKSVRQ